MHIVISIYKCINKTMERQRERERERERETQRETERDSSAVSNSGMASTTWSIGLARPFFSDEEIIHFERYDAPKMGRMM